MTMKQRLCSTGLGVMISLLMTFVGIAWGTDDRPAAFSPRTGSPMGVSAPADVFWSQPADLNGSKVSSEIISELDIVSEVANDFSSPSDTRVTRVSWWGGPYIWEEGDPQVTDFNIFFYDDAVCAPGTLIAWYVGIATTATLVGTDGLGNPVYRYSANVSVPITGGETYWCSIQADNHSHPPQWGRQQATGSDGCASMIKSDYFGYPAWTSISSIVGETWDASQELEINTATVEACCFANGLCEMLLPADCTAQEGQAQGEASQCDPNPCTQPEFQACCIFGGTCVLISVPDCNDLGGEPQGTGSVCDPNPCPQTTQACCFTGGFCADLDPDTCTGSGGTPQGPGTDCDPNPCGVEACCFEDGTCLALDPTTCANTTGDPQGPDSVCDPNPCPQPPARACCFDDGTCQMQTPIACNNAGGASLGSGSVCDPNPCPQPEPEACCFEDGTCAMQLADDCITASGLPGGTGSSCDPNLCPLVVPTEERSWGQIKATYR